MANSSLPNHRHISVVGTAQLKVKPDIAVLHLEVESLKSTSLEAKQEVDNRVNNFLDGLAQFGIDEDNVSASTVSTEPQYSYSKMDSKKLDGYIAQRNLKVTLNEITQLNTLMDFALSVKLNKIRNIELKSSNEQSFKDEVNDLAVKNAKQQGVSLAKAFDAKLGRIYSINSTSNQSRQRYGANRDIEHIMVTGSRMNQSAKPGKYLQENLVFSASISVVFDLEVE
jgi:uncharacterized protein YggE